MSETPSGMAEQILAFCEELRSEDVAIGTSEIQDAFRALEIVPWTEPVDFRESLATTLAKSPKDREIFDLVFDRHFFRATEAASLEFAPEGGEGRKAALSDEVREELSMEALAEAIRQAIAEGDESAMNELARLAIEAFGRQGESSGVVGVDMQRIRRGLGLSPHPTQAVTAKPMARTLTGTRSHASNASSGANSSASRSRSRASCPRPGRSRT